MPASLYPRNHIDGFANDTSGRERLGIAFTLFPAFKRRSYRQFGKGETVRQTEDEHTLAKGRDQEVRVASDDGSRTGGQCNFQVFVVFGSRQSMTPPTGSNRRPYSRRCWWSGLCRTWSHENNISAWDVYAEQHEPRLGFRGGVCGCCGECWLRGSATSFTYCSAQRLRHHAAEFRFLLWIKWLPADAVHWSAKSRILSVASRGASRSGTTSQALHEAGDNSVTVESRRRRYASVALMPIWHFRTPRPKFHQPFGFRPPRFDGASPAGFLGRMAPRRVAIYISPQRYISSISGSSVRPNVVSAYSTLRGTWV